MSQRTLEQEHNQERDEENPVTRTINIIAGGFPRGGTTKLAWKKHIKEVLNVSSRMIKKPTPEIVFSSSDLGGVLPGHDDPMVISTIIVNAEVNRVFVDQGSSAAIIFLDAFDKLGLKNTDLQMHKEELVGFSGEKVHPKEFVTLHLTLGTRPKTRTVKVDFLVVDGPSAYNVILRRPTLNKISAVISMASLTIKFFTDNGEVATVKADQVATR